jgi:hypothetical protein
VTLACATLEGTRHKLADAEAHVPNAAGLYAIYGDVQAPNRLLAPGRDGLLGRSLSGVRTCRTSRLLRVK